MELMGDITTRRTQPVTCYFVVPCYNEREALPFTVPQLLQKMDELIANASLAIDSRILLCDDGSTDGTWSYIQELHASDRRVCGIYLSRNRGHQNALLAGLMAARGKCDATISLDADLQDDISVIDQFIEQYRQGCEVVFGVRGNRASDTEFKRSTARMFYRLMNKMGAEVVEDHADYRLLGAKALDALAQYPEENLFLRGLACDLGFKTATVVYDRAKRVAGESKYPLRKMISFALDGITSFSSRPLTIVSGLGILISCLSVFGLLYALIAKAMGVAVSGWTAIVCSIWLLGGIQLLCIGIIGTYVGKIYVETKRRPRYLIEEELFS